MSGRKTHKGIYRPKHPEMYKGDPKGIVYRSSWERSVFFWLDGNPKVEQWASEEFFIPYVNELDMSVHRYFPDVWIKMKDGKVILVEIKPKKETIPPSGGKGKPKKRLMEESLTYSVNHAKWKAADKFCKDRGWMFSVWTEDTLRGLNIRIV